MSEKFNISKKNLFEIKTRIEQMKKHPNLTRDDLAYIEAISEAYFKFAPGNRVAFEFGAIEGYFKAMQTYAEVDSTKTFKLDDVSKIIS